MWFSNRSDTNRAVQSQKKARSLKFRIKEADGLYFPSSKNKGADQLRDNLCFRLCRLVFPWCCSNSDNEPDKSLSWPLFGVGVFSFIASKFRDTCIRQ